MKSQKALTRAEEEIMQVLWELDKAFVKDIVDQLPEPKPHYNTVSTIIKILCDKEFVGFESSVSRTGITRLFKKRTIVRKR